MIWIITCSQNRQNPPKKRLVKVYNIYFNLLILIFKRLQWCFDNQLTVNNFNLYYQIALLVIEMNMH